MHRLMAAWEWFDTVTLQSLVDFREATFLSSPRLIVDEANLTVSLAHFDDTSVIIGDLQHEKTPGEANANAKTVNKRIFKNVMQGGESPHRSHVEQHRQGMFAAANSVDADVLMVSLATTMHEDVCFYRKKSDCKDVGKASNTVGAVYGAMRWCQVDRTYMGKRKVAKGIMANMDCNTKTDIVARVQQEHTKRKTEAEHKEKEKNG